MEENKNMNTQENQEPEKAPVPEKKTLFQKVKAMPATIKARHEEKKKAKAEKPKSDKKKNIAIGLGAVGLLIGAAAAAVATAKRTGSDEVYDPDMGTEPGDWEPEDMESVESTEETSEEEVNAE